MESIDEKRNYPCRTFVHLAGALESADLGGHAGGRHDLCLGLSAVRSQDRRRRRCADRKADRTCAGTTEVVRGDGGLVTGERAQVQRLLHVGGEIRGGERDLRALFSEESACAHFRLRSGLAGPFRHRDRLRGGGVTQALRPPASQSSRAITASRLISPDLYACRNAS